MGKKSAPLRMSPRERKLLETWVRARTAPQRVAFRAHICVLAADGLSATDIASRLSTSRPTVLLWKKRFEELGPEGLTKDAPRGPSPRRLDAATRQAIVDATVKAPPPDRSHWTTRSLAKTLGVSNATVSRVWRACGIKRHRKTRNGRSKADESEHKVSELIGVDVHPPFKAWVKRIGPEPARIAPDVVSGAGTEMRKAISETIRYLGLLIAAAPRFAHSQAVQTQGEDPMNWKEEFQRWFAAAAFAEEGEHKTALQIATAPIPEAQEAPAVTPALSKVFAAAAFAEENCHEIATEILFGARRKNSFLSTVGLATVRVWYGTASLGESFVEAVGLAGARLRLVSVSL